MTRHETANSHASSGDDVMNPTDPEAFDVREFARTAQGNHRGQLDLEALGTAKLGPDVARLVRTLRDLERSTMQRMRNLLVTATHKDARVTAFLTTWAFEKFWIADALDAVLEALGNELDLPAVDGRPRKKLGERIERRGAVARAISANFAGPQIVAEHVATGLIDEWITQAAYRRLAEASAALTDVVEMVLTIKERHIRFLSEEVERRLTASSRARALTRRAIKRAVWPIGAVELSGEERFAFETFVFGTPAGKLEAARISTLVAAFPGIGMSVASTVSARLVP